MSDKTDKAVIKLLEQMNKRLDDLESTKKEPEIVEEEIVEDDKKESSIEDLKKQLAEKDIEIKELTKHTDKKEEGDFVDEVNKLLKKG